MFEYEKKNWNKKKLIHTPPDVKSKDCTPIESSREPQPAQRAASKDPIPLHVWLLSKTNPRTNWVGRTHFLAEHPTNDVFHFCFSPSLAAERRSSYEFAVIMVSYGAPVTLVPHECSQEGSFGVSWNFLKLLIFCK